MNNSADVSERVLVLTPTGNDAANAVFVLSQWSLTGAICQSCSDLAGKFSEGAGALLIAEEGLTAETVACLLKLLTDQPPWSDIPLLVITSAEETEVAGQALLDTFAPHGNITLVERPLRPISLVSALRVALRARRRQYELRDFLEEQRQATRRVQLLADAAHTLLSSEAPETIVREIFASLAPELDVQVYLNFMLAGDGTTLLLDSCAGIEETMIHQVKSFTLGAPVCGWVAQQRKAWTISDVQHFDDPPLPFLRRAGVRAYSCHPLLVGERLLGTLSFGSRTRDVFSEQEIKYLGTICDFIALAQERALDRRALEQRVRERTARLQETITELEAFSYSVSHDLRAPLRAMQGYSQFLLEDYGNKLDDTGLDYITRITKAAERLDRLVSDILTYSRISRAQIKTGPIDLERLIQEVVQSYPAMQPDKADIIVERPLLPAIGHEGSLTQCISNLLDNAVKFIPEGTKPRVRIWTEASGEKKVRINFQDNGIGIPAEHQHRIFQMFEKAPQSKAYEGTGIGLAIVRKAAERMGGEVGVVSADNQGSRFWIELPKAI